MKRIISTLAGILLAYTISLGQDYATARGGTVYASFSDFEPKKDFYYRYDKVIKKSDKAGLISGSLHFKDITKGFVFLGKGQSRESVVSWAVLDGVSEQTMQEIADEFGQMMLRKIENLGITLIPDADITGAKKYDKVLEKSDKKERSKESLGRVKIKSANDAPYFKFNPLTTPGMIAKVASDAGGDMIVYDIVIDFARFDIQASRWTNKNYGIGYDLVNTKTSADVMPQISIATTTGGGQTSQVATMLTFYNDKKLGSSISLGKNLYYEENYATEVDSYKGEMPAEIKNGLSLNTRTTGTFVIKADEQKYKEVVLKALDKYSDYLMELISEEIR